MSCSFYLALPYSYSTCCGVVILPSQVSRGETKLTIHCVPAYYSKDGVRQAACTAGWDKVFQFIGRSFLILTSRLPNKMRNFESIFFPLTGNLLENALL